MQQAAISAALSVLLGIFMGALYDVIRFARLVFGFRVSPLSKQNKNIVGYIFVSLTDFLFFVILAVCMCVFFFLTGDGRMRAYGLFGAFLGFWLYYNTVGRLFISVSTALVTLFKKAVKCALRLLLTPIMFLARHIKKIVLRILKLPIVTSGVKRYNDYISKMKKNAVCKARKKQMRKHGAILNGGMYGKEKIK